MSLHIVFDFRRYNTVLTITATKHTLLVEQHISNKTMLACVRIFYSLSIFSIQDDISNFPQALHRHMVSQSKEIARQCVEPPIKRKPNEPKFEPGPSLKKATEFLIDCVKRLPTERCQFCNKICFPEDPKVYI